MVRWISGKSNNDDRKTNQRGIKVNSSSSHSNNCLTKTKNQEDYSKLEVQQILLYDSNVTMVKGDMSTATTVSSTPNKPLKPIPIDPDYAELHRQAIEAISVKNFDALSEYVCKHPDIILYPCRKDDLMNMKVHGVHGGTILHLLVSDKPKLKYKIPQKQKDQIQVKEVFVTSSIKEHHLHLIAKLRSEALWTMDDYGRLPLHSAVMTMVLHRQELYGTFCHKHDESHGNLPLFVNQLPNCVEILLTLYPQAASTIDMKGNLPLHYAMNFPPDFENSSQPAPGSSQLEKAYPSLNKSFRHRNQDMYSSSVIAVDIAFLLSDIFPRGLTQRNQMGDTPIHSLSSKGPMINLSVLELILMFHCVKKISLFERNNTDDQPLHLAIKSGAPLEAIKHFATAERISSTGDRLFEQRDAHGSTPLQLALQSYIVPTSFPLVSLILAVAPPTATVPDGKGVLPIIQATRLQLPDDVVQSILEHDMPIELSSQTAGYGNFEKITKRAHHYSWWHIAVDCKDKYINMVRSFLITKATLVQVLQLAQQVGPDGSSILLRAVSPQFRKMLRSLLILYKRYEVQTLVSRNYETPYTFLAIDHGKKAANKETNEHKKILLRCYQHEDAFVAEKAIRRDFKLSNEFIEKVVNYHADKDEFALKTNSFYSISFERPCHTLEQVFAAVSPWERTGLWFTKCSVVIKQILLSVQHLHQRHLVHGHLDPHNIGKYGNTWKLINVGMATRVGDNMRGCLRSCAPPESIIDNVRRPKLQPYSPNRVRFEDQRYFDAVDEEYEESRNDSCCLQEPLNCIVKDGTVAVRSDLSFFPEKALASWDIWGVGLVIVQLYLGPCPYLPNFEKSEDAHIRNLYNFNTSVLQNICDLVRDIDEDASDLVSLCLQPDPSRRISVADILGHRYFSTNPSICFF